MSLARKWNVAATAVTLVLAGWGCSGGGDAKTEKAEEATPGGTRAATSSDKQTKDGGSASASKAASASPRRIMILTNGNSPFWDAARAGVKAAERDLKLTEDSLSAVLDVNDATQQGQIDK